MTASAQQPSQPPSGFTRLASAVSLPELELGVLALWERLDAFKESIRRRQAGPVFTFSDGPPFATGLPHYGHLLAGTIKDIVPRYWAMRGHRVERRFGWDCHGLPIEDLAQKALGLHGPAEIRAVGVDVFNEQCRSMVQTYVGEWRRTVQRMGRWVDFDNDYKTMDTPYMESVWWVFKQLWQQGRIYRSHRIMPYDPSLATPLSNFEAGNNYKDVQDPAVTIRFRLLPESRLQDGTALPDATSLLAWTTTPWTLPSNLALCVGPDIAYCLVQDAATLEHLVRGPGAPGRPLGRATEVPRAQDHAGPCAPWPALHSAAALLPGRARGLPRAGRLRTSPPRTAPASSTRRRPTARTTTGSAAARASPWSIPWTRSAASPPPSRNMPGCSARMPTRRSSAGSRRPACSGARPPSTTPTPSANAARRR